MNGAIEAMGRLGLVLIAIGIGIGVVVAENQLFIALTGRPAEFWSFKVLIVATPFLALAFAGEGPRLPWLVGLALTLGLWGYQLYEGVRYQWHPDGSGASMGTAFLILASPLVFTPIVLAIRAARRKSRRPG